MDERALPPKLTRDGMDWRLPGGSGSDNGVVAARRRRIQYHYPLPIEKAMTAERMGVCRQERREINGPDCKSDGLTTESHNVRLTRGLVVIMNSREK